MRRLIFGAWLGWCGLAAASDQALVLDSPANGTYTIPGSTLFTSVPALRVEMRLVGNGSTPPGCAGFANAVWQFGGTFAFECLNATQFGFFDNSVSAGAVWNTPSQTDVLLRMQWDGTNALGGGAGCRYVEMWQTSTGAPLMSPVVDCRGGGGPRSLAGLQGIGSATNLGAMRIDWVRVYNTAESTGSSSPRNGEPSCSGFLDWELDGTLSDCSGHGANLSVSSPRFVTAPAYSPIVLPRMLTGAARWMTNPVTVRAGQPWQIDASQSYGFCNPDNRTVSWQQLAGPANAVISSRTNISPTITFPQFGQYTIQLTETDCNGTSQANLVVGAVATDANGIVINSDPKFAYMFGSEPIWGASAWPQMDQDQKTLADIYSNQYPFDPNAPEWGNQAGTITISGATVTGSGTNFQSLFCGGGATPDGSLMVIKTPADGWKWGQIASCNSSTSITLSVGGSGNWPFSACTTSGCNYGKVLAANEGCWIGGSDNCDYYDNILAYYNLYYRSGLTAYLTAARNLAAIWIQNPSLSRQFDGSTWPGNMNPNPRQMGFSGLAWWAYESGQAIWPRLRTLAVLDDITSPALLGDIREQGYELKFQADLDVLDPNTASQPWNSNLLASIANKWAPQQLKTGPGAGSWVNYFFGDIDSQGGITLTHNSTTVNVTGATGAFNPQIGYMLTVPGNTGGYAVTSNYTGGPSGTFQITPAWAGTTQTIPAQPADSSTNAYFLNGLIAGVGNQPFIVGLDGNIWEHVYLATGDARAKQFTIDVANYLNNTGWRKSDNGMYYGAVVAGCEPQSWAETAPSLCTLLSGASPNCALNPAPGCNNVAQQDRYLTGEASGAFTGAFLNSSGSTQAMIKTMADTLIGAALGAGGGPFSDANYVRTNDGKHKTFGFWWGIGNTPSWSAARLGGLSAPINRTLSIGFRLADVPGATQVRVTLIKPDGSSTTTTCSTSPCAVTADAREGQHSYTLTFLSASSQTLSANPATLIAVP